MLRILLSSNKNKKNIDTYCFVTSFWLFIFEKWCKCTLKKRSEKKIFKLVFCWHLEGQWRKWQDPDPLVRGMDPRLRIHNKMSWIRNTAAIYYFFLSSLPWFRLGEGSKPTAPMGGSNPAAPAIPALSKGGSKPPRISPPTACDAWSKAAPAPTCINEVATEVKGTDRPE